MRRGRTLTRGTANLCLGLRQPAFELHVTAARPTPTNYRARRDARSPHLPGTTTTDWSYYHDGQTTMEDLQVQGSTSTVTRYGLGARGIDECERQVNGGTTSVWYPVFDGHGNQCGTLSRSGTNSFTLSNVRTFDAGATSAEAPKLGIQPAATADPWATCKTTNRGWCT